MKLIVSLLVILRQTVTELCASMPTALVLRTFVQHLIAFCSLPEAASNVISGRFVGPIVHDSPVNFVILAQIVLEKLHLKPSEAEFSTVFELR